jgi:hypothetical protein
VFLDKDRMMDNVKKHNISDKYPVEKTFEGSGCGIF